MLGTAKEMARPHFGSRFHADAQRFLYPHGRRVDSGSLASACYYRHHHYCGSNHLPYLEV